MNLKKRKRNDAAMTMKLPMNADILPPSDDRIFKALLTHPGAKPALIDLVSAVIK